MGVCPQIRFGEDLMSRVSYVMMHPGGDHELTRVARAAIIDAVDGLLSAHGFAPDRLLEVVVVANPIMHHLFLGSIPQRRGRRLSGSSQTKP